MKDIFRPIREGVCTLRKLYTRNYDDWDTTVAAVTQKRLSLEQMGKEVPEHIQSVADFGESEMVAQKGVERISAGEAGKVINVKVES